MEQNNGFVRIDMEPVADNSVARSGLLISNDPEPEPAKIYRLKNEKVIVHHLD